MGLFDKKDPQKKAKPGLPSFPALSARSESGEKKGGAPLWTGAGGRAEDLLGTTSRSTGMVERLRTLRPNELAFLTAGLGILILAPMAEFLLMGPDKTPTMKPAFSDRSAGPGFEESPSPFEEGINGIAQGGLLGGNKELITPNSSADPLNLIMKGAQEGGASNAPAGTIPAATPEPRREEPSSSNWKDVLTSAKTAVKAAVSKAPGLPRPTEKLSGQMRGLATLSSGAGGGGAGGGASSAASVAAAPMVNLAPLSSKGLVSTPARSSSLNTIQAAAGFKGLASGGTSGGGAGSGRGSGTSGAGGFLQDVNANKAFAAAASGGGTLTGGGRMANGDATALPSGNSAKDVSTLTKNKTEDLNELRKKMEMQKAIDLEWDKKNYDQLGRKKMEEQILVQTLAQTAQQAFLKVLDKLLNPQGKQQQAAQ